MSIYDGIFYAFAIITIVSAFLVVLSKNIIHSAVALFVTLFSVAALFALLYADFIAVTQIMIYIGGILILLMFGVMLTTKITDVKIKTKNINTLSAAIFVIGITAVLIYIMLTTNWRVVEIIEYEVTINRIGVLLLTDYLLPFEIASVVLLVALIGAAMYARKSK
jgi:NADH-quinone oxidoreductase subunit J